MSQPEPLTEQQLDEIAGRTDAATPGDWFAVELPADENHRHPAHWVKTEYEDGNCTSSQVVADCPWRQADAEFIAHARTDVPALVAEIRRQRAELASARGQAIAWAADAADAKLSAEPDHNRASALYELLLQLRGELPCTCARASGLHEKGCRKYVPGHELISRHNQLAIYRVAHPLPAVAARTAPAPTAAPLAASQPSEAPVEGETATRASTGRVRDPRRTLTPNEYDAAWHAVEGAAGEEGADPGTVLHAVLDRLGIEWQDAAQPTA